MFCVEDVFSGETDEPREDALLDRVARQAATLCGVSIGLVTSLEGDRQRFVGRFGTDLRGTSRRDSFCAHAVLSLEPLVVEDATTDPRFDDTLLVMAEPRVRFYAGAPIFDEAGLPLGSVCVLDPAPRTIGNPCLMHLQRLARMTGVVLSARKALRSTLGLVADPERVREPLDRLDASLLPLFEEANGFRAPRARLG